LLVAPAALLEGLAAVVPASELAAAAVEGEERFLAAVGVVAAAVSLLPCAAAAAVGVGASGSPGM
jgi:hypothetical protein